MASKALEVNLACSRVDVTVDQRYRVLQEVMGDYHGVRQGIGGLLEEVCHPYKNWAFVIREARSYALNYLHVLKDHPKGPEALGVYADIFFQAVESAPEETVKSDAADNLLLLIVNLLKEGKAPHSGFLPVLDHVFERIGTLPGEVFLLFVKSFYPINRIGAMFGQWLGQGASFSAINRLLLESCRITYDAWLKEDDPLEWFTEESGAAPGEALARIFEPIARTRLNALRGELGTMANPPGASASRGLLDRLIALPGNADIVSAYGEVPRMLLTAAAVEEEGYRWKLLFLLRNMTISGLSSIHEETLRDINRTLSWLMEHVDIKRFRASLEKTFDILNESAPRFPMTVLDCVLNIGQGVYRTDESDLVDYFIDSVVSLGFKSPGIRGVGEDWQMRADPAHVQNIRTWLELIELNPKWSKKLLSSLAVHLSLEGVFIRDTDLFPRDVSRFLNSDISPVYNLAKQLARLFPVYFNDIGAEGRLRDVSTRIDEICLRKDPLVHFLRKQSHVESSNRIMGLMEGTLHFWQTRSKEPLKPFLPPQIYDAIEVEGPFIDGVHRAMDRLRSSLGLEQPADLLGLDEDQLRGSLSGVPGVSETDVERVGTAVSLYRLLHEKYHPDFTDANALEARLRACGLPDPGELTATLSLADDMEKLEGLLAYLEKLKEIILSPQSYEVREDIYRKRHFSVDIPSMYGSYHEMKFDALGMTFRVESLVNVLFENMVEKVEMGLITRATFSRILDCLRLFDRGLKLDGISSLEIERQLDLLTRSLEIRGFSQTQYVDIFRGFSQAVNNVVNDHFNNIHEENILKIAERVPAELVLPRYLPPEGTVDSENRGHRVTEIFIRDRIATSLGLQQLDTFVGRVLKTLYEQSRSLPKESLRLLLGYDPQKAVTPLSPVKNGLSDIIHLGSKGLNLVKIRGLGLPVPPGFIITTEVFRCREIVDRYAPARENFRAQVTQEVTSLEARAGRRFGDPRNPLLLSVRSGSAVSQPGMMVTFLDVGINEEIVRGMVAGTGNPWFAWDTYRRFLQSYGMSFGMDRNDFDAVMNGFKRRLGLQYKKDFSGPQMKELALAYKSMIRDHGIAVEESPPEQLYLAVGRVFDSWQASKAKTYRSIMNISDDWGTAVTVQAMVFGNYSRESGSGVFFTHNPRWSGDMLVLWGDYTPGNQGEDVVSGLVRTHPVSNRQADIESRPAETTLENRFPEIYQGMRNWAKTLIYDNRWSPQEMEFTFEGPKANDLYFLQTRDMSMREKTKAYSFDKSATPQAERIGHGIGVSGGAMVGRVVFSLEEIEHWRKAEPDTPLIMVRSDTVPDDIREINGADGLLTARGGSTSHAAIVAHRLGKTCVVGCASLICMEKDRACAVGDRRLESGDWGSIDGLEGSVYQGKMKIQEA